MGALTVVMIAATWWALTDKRFFASTFAAEDNVVEYGTAIFLLLSAGLFAWRALRLAGVRGAGFVAATLVYAALFFFAGGEEVSWGQRILGVESSEFFQQNNDQGEITLHNLVVGGVKLDEVLFGPVLSVVILSYLLGLPFAWARWGWAQALVARLAIPVPRPRHALATLLVTLLIGLLDASRKWEVYELAFALITLAIFLNPRNERLYARAG